MCLLSSKLYTFIDTAFLQGRSVVDIAQQLCDGGSDIIQLRCKDLPLHGALRLAEQVLPITSRAGVPLVINDYLAVALEIKASYCHLGQEDFFDAGHRCVDEIRPQGVTLGIGLSSHGPEQAKRAVEAGADYLGVGPVFATSTKPGATPVTLDFVRWAAANISIPWFAIGGINLETLEPVLAAGARRICVVSAILNARDIVRACQDFKRRLSS
jgi:thiamine-phosphate pyrophosphorylase